MVMNHSVILNNVHSLEKFESIDEMRRCSRLYAYP